MNFKDFQIKNHILIYYDSSSIFKEEIVQLQKEIGNWYDSKYIGSWIYRIKYLSEIQVPYQI